MTFYAGDYVGLVGSWSDEFGLEPIGLVVGTCYSDEEEYGLIYVLEPCGQVIEWPDCDLQIMFRRPGLEAPFDSCYFGAKY